MDTFTYSYLAKLIFDGNIPIQGLMKDLPIGYPIIIYFTKALQLNFNHLVTFQLLFYFLSFIFLCFQFSKFTKLGGLVTVFTFIFYSLNSYTIRHIFKIYPDSLYVSFLILLVGGLLYYFREKNKISLFIVFFSILGAVLLRSNGIYLYFIFLILFLDYLNNKNGLKFYFISCLVFFFLVSALNYTVKGYFAPFDKNRVLNVVNALSYDDSSIKNDSVKKVFKSKKPPRNKMFVDYFMSFIERHASYYYSMQQTNYERITKNKTFSNLDQEFFDGDLSVRSTDVELLKFMFQEKNNYSYIKKSVDFQSGKNNLWLYSIYAIQETIYHLRINLLFYILFLVSLLYYFGLMLSTKKLYFFNIIYLIHFLSLIILPFIHGRFIYRYIQVSEFIIYIGAILFLMDMCFRKSLKKSD